MTTHRKMIKGVLALILAFLSFITVASNALFSDRVSNQMAFDAHALEVYTITYHLNGGTQGSGAVEEYKVLTETFNLPKPTKVGYSFAGWYEDASFSGSAVTKIELGSTGDKEFYAKWTPNNDTAYVVKHWTQNLGAASAQNSTNYTLHTTEKKTGTTDASITPAVKSIAGFKAPSTQTAKIAPDGSTEVNYYYTRNNYTFTLGSDAAVNTAGSTITGSYQYGATITLKATPIFGYTWSKWTSSNVSLVEHFTAAETTFTMPAGDIAMTPSAPATNYTISYKLNGGTLTSNAISSYTIVSETFALSKPTKVGYSFGGWYTSSDLTGSAVTQIEKGTTGNKTFYAKWIANTNTAYTVKHWTQNVGAGSAQNSTNYTLYLTDYLTGTTGANVTPAVNTITGFTAPSKKTAAIAADGSTVVNYYYTRNSYTFTLGSGTGVSTSGSTASGSYQHGATITLKAAANSGYTWSKWTSSNTGLVANTTTANTTFKMPVGDVAMTPSATLNSYSITYNLNGGTQGSGATSSYNVTTATFSLPTPTKTGYTFGGWYTASDFSGSAVTQIAKGSTGNKTFYAKWTANTNTAYTVKHWTQNLGAASTQNSTNYTLNATENKTGTTGANVTPAVKSITGFKAPSTQTVTIAANGSTVVNYYYTRNSYTFTLGSTTGVSTTGSTASGSYQYGATITLKATANSGYTWSKWTSSNTSLVANKTTANTTFTMPAGNIKMTPGATLNSYSISYTLNGGTQGSGAVTSYNVTTATFNLPTPSKTGYTFAGWYEKSDFSGSAVTQIAKGSTGNKTFYAKWTANTNTAYTVKHWTQNLGAASTQNSTNYSLNATENKTGTTGASVTPAVKSITGFKAPSTQTVTIAANGSTVVNYYYTRNSYTFTLGSGTGVSTTGSTASGSYQYGATITLKATANTGYTWSKWTSSNTSLVANKTTANTTFTMPAGDVKMTPGATLNSYSISYTLNGGTQGSGAVTSYNVTTATFSLPTPTKTGYTFSGWYTASDFSGSAVTQIAKGSTGNKAFYAKWTANTNTAYTVKHWTQNLGAASTQNSTNYSLNATENKTGTTGASVTPAVKSITGFKAPSTQTVTIAANGSTVVNYYYTRNSYTFTLGSGTGVSTTGSTASGSYQYGATITLKATANTGYTWNKWTSSNTGLVGNKTNANTTFTMPAGNITMTPSATMATYTITYNLNGGTQGSGATTSYNVTTTTFSLPTPTKTGYTFAGWYEKSDFSGSSVTQIAKGSTGNKTFYAKWTALKPVLAVGNTWFTQGNSPGISRSSITSIEFKDSGAPSSYAYSWDASDGMKGTVTAYLTSSGSGTYELTLVGNGYGTIYANPDSSYAFSGDAEGSSFTALTAITGMSYLNTSEAETMSYMFSYATSLASIDLSNFSVARCTDLSGLFSNCTSLQVVDFSKIGSTSAVTSLDSMFYRCSSLEHIIFGDNFTTESVTTMGMMFYRCENLTTLDLSNFSTASLTWGSGSYGMFFNCIRLEEITLGADFEFIGEDGYLPEPDDKYIDGADGTWYNTTTGRTYSPENLADKHGGTTYTYIANHGASTCTVTVDSGDMLHAYVMYNGQKYYYDESFEVNVGDTITLHLISDDDSFVTDEGDVAFGSSRAFFVYYNKFFTGTHEIYASTSTEEFSTYTITVTDDIWLWYSSSYKDI